MQTSRCSAFAACELLTPHSQPALLPCKETSLLLHHPLGARRQHDACTLMGNRLAVSDAFATKLGRRGRVRHRQCPRHISHLPYVPGS